MAQQSRWKKRQLKKLLPPGTRLKRNTTAVLEERKNQAFCADILGGGTNFQERVTSDAASALRRSPQV